MASVMKPAKPEAAPALYRLLTDSALSRAALGACGVPLAILDARIPARSLTYVNPAFEGFFGYRAADALGHPLAKLLFRNDEPLVHRLLAEPGSRWKLRAWGKDGAVRHVDVSLGACGVPLAILDARIPARSLTYVNPAFETFFGYRAGDSLGHPLAKLLFRNDEPLVHRLLAEPSSRWKLRAWGKDGAVRHVDVSLGAVHSAAGELTHWVVAFSDRGEIEKLRAELEGLKSLAAAP